VLGEQCVRVNVQRSGTASLLRWLFAHIVGTCRKGRQVVVYPMRDLPAG